MVLRFIVRGSTGNEYEIIASRLGDNFRMSCSCEAGQKGTCCKHRFALLEGDVSHLISSNSQEIDQLRVLVRGSEVERRYRMVCKLEADKTALEHALRAQKKALAREMAA